MADLDVTDVVCTRNRAVALRRMPETAAALRIPAGLAREFNVVDVGGNDDTAAVVDSFADGPA
jgi:hypothetical protein